MTQHKIWGLTDEQNNQIAEYDKQFGYHQANMLTASTSAEAAYNKMRNALIVAYKRLNESAVTR